METDFKKVVGDRLRMVRIEKRLTQEEMGEKLNLSTSAYCKLEYGETDLTLTRLNQIAEVLKMNPMDLFQKVNGDTNFYQCNGVGIAKDYGSINTINIDSNQDLKELIKANSRLIDMLCKRIDNLERQNDQQPGR